MRGLRKYRGTWPFALSQAIGKPIVHADTAARPPQQRRHVRTAELLVQEPGGLLEHLLCDGRPREPGELSRAPMAFPCFGLCRASGCEYSLNVGSGNPKIVPARTFQSPLSSDASSIAASKSAKRPSACVCLPWRTCM